IIKEELGKLRVRQENLHIERFLSSINGYVEGIRTKELEKAISMMGDTDPATAMIMDSLSKSLAKKIMHNFIREVKLTNGSSMDMDKFLTIFLGSENVPGHPGGHPVQHPDKEKEDVPKHPHAEIEK
ncbi:MAG: hypothetical protein KAS67_02080, partial [Thermoplasmata archaeon]|nr:hypothetical protein [Thermoplasmata archaeon]